MEEYPDHLPTITLQISQALVDKYSKVAEDHNPIHQDTEAAYKGPFGKPVAHGMLVLSTASQIMTTTFGKRWAEKGSLKVRWKSPTAIPSSICTSAQLKSASQEQIKYEIECKDNDGILLFSGTATLRLDT
jgi:acyl dehydratase